MPARPVCTLLLLLTVALLAACAPTPITINASADVAVVHVAVHSVIVEDYTVPLSREQAGAPGAFQSGWRPLPSAATQPAFEQMVLADLKRSLRPNAQNGPALRVTLLESHAFYEKRAADDIAFVGIVSALSARQMMCKAIANVGYGAASTKLTAEVTQMIDGSSVSRDVDRQNIEACEAGLVEKLSRDVGHWVEKLTSGS
jgi:hypothetical protein